MLSLPGIYEDGKITLSYASNEALPEVSNVVITFAEDKDLVGVKIKEESVSSFKSTNKNEEYYESIREFERVKAQGDINIIDSQDKYSFPLNDYSQGGLSFIADKVFDIGQEISAGITDPGTPDMVLMELGMEVRGIFNSENQFKIGCMFKDPVDEDLWHGLLQYLG